MPKVGLLSGKINKKNIKQPSHTQFFYEGKNCKHLRFLSKSEKGI